MIFLSAKISEGRMAAVVKIESQIKNFANNSKIRKICEKGVEFFETTNEYSLEKILGEIR